MIVLMAVVLTHVVCIGTTRGMRGLRRGECVRHINAGAPCHVCVDMTEQYEFLLTLVLTDSVEPIQVPLITNK